VVGWERKNCILALFLTPNYFESMERQQRFQENDKRGGALIKFLNILDRGYRSTRAACGMASNSFTSQRLPSPTESSRQKRLSKLLLLPQIGRETKGLSG
jgi:hypothetical protein